MSSDLSLKEIQKEWHGTLRSYVMGFFSCLLLTIASFIFVKTKFFSGPILVNVIIVLALIQAVVQSLFFMHVGQEAKPRWETLVFAFMLLILFVIVIGTLWIMYDLNERMMFDMPMDMPHD